MAMENGPFEDVFPIELIGIFQPSAHVACVALHGVNPPTHVSTYVYFQAPHFLNRVMALDAFTGETLWTYEEPVARYKKTDVFRGSECGVFVSTVWGAQHEGGGLFFGGETWK